MELNGQLLYAGISGLGLYGTVAQVNAVLLGGGCSEAVQCFMRYRRQDLCVRQCSMSVVLYLSGTCARTVS